MCAHELLLCATACSCAAAFMLRCNRAHDKELAVAQSKLEEVEEQVKAKTGDVDRC